jgi:hypothetical protein
VFYIGRQVEEQLDALPGDEFETLAAIVVDQVVPGRHLPEQEIGDTPAPAGGGTVTSGVIQLG